MIVKLNTGGSSYFTYKIETTQDLEQKINYIREHIEDDILITEDGCEVLSENLMRDPDQIEAFMQEKEA